LFKPFLKIVTPFITIQPVIQYRMFVGGSISHPIAQHQQRQERFSEIQLLCTQLIPSYRNLLPERLTPYLLSTASSGGLHTLSAQRMR
jgi:hypothetical protein